MSCDCTSCRVDLRDSAVYGYVLGGAETFVTDIASCIAGVGGGDVSGDLLPAIPQATASGPGVGLDAVGGSLEIANRSREGPFDIHQDHPRSDASPQLLQDTQGCLFRLNSNDPMDQISHQSMEYSSTTHAFWTNAALNTGFITWGERMPCRPPCSYSMPLDISYQTCRFCNSW